ncbi:glycosyltransferase [Paracoccus sp. S-4012]|uniref:glycosyltransferase family 4 protein n=1 Tax=Paracoccus sp. S-4012 TaxID=2665648 RepID=UPI0012B01781|nr:glycosyltransferase family 4 protein [Paracoccus sp. S-4012]MRX51827.1 glycosyltransferase [Paracoccus sp. S-4012]
MNDLFPSAAATAPLPLSRSGRPRGRASALLLVSELEDFTISFANGVAAHVPVILGVPRRQYAGLAEWFDPAVDLRLLDWPRHSSLRNPLFLASLLRLVRRERPGVIHLLSNNTLWLNLAAPFWRDTPLVTTVHDVTMHPGDAETGKLPVWATTLMARQSRDLVVHGEALRDMAADRFAKPRRQVHVLSHPAILRYAELARREGLARRSEGTFTVLLFGRIYAYKGIELMIRAEALTREIPNLRIVIAGRGDDPRMFRDRMGDPGRYDIRNRFIPDPEVAQLFLDADVVALPYAEGSQSGVLQIAAAFGKPVVATDVGEIGTTVREAGIGIVVRPGDAPGLAHAMERLAAKPRLREAFGSRAAAWANGENAPAAVGAEAARLYRRLAAARHEVAT